MNPLQLLGSGKRPSCTEQSTTLAPLQAGVVAAGAGRDVVVTDPDQPPPPPSPPPPPEAEQEPSPLLDPMSMYLSPNPWILGTLGYFDHSIPP